MPVSPPAEEEETEEEIEDEIEEEPSTPPAEGEEEEEEEEIEEEGETSSPPAEETPPTPPPAFSDDYESYSVSDANLEPWLYYVDTFGPSGTYLGWYGGTPAPSNGPQVSSIVTEDGNNLLNTYSNYGDSAHSSGNFIETCIYRDGGLISQDMVGSWQLTFLAKSPAENNCGGTNANNGASGGTCHAFVKVLDSSTFAQLLSEKEETTSASVDGESYVLAFEITESMVGHILQTGFMNFAGSYAPTGMHYDDVSLKSYTPDEESSPDQEPPPPPAEEPSVPQTDGEMICYGETQEQISVEQTCDSDEMGFAPNPFAGEGYYLIDMRCKETSLVGCVGQSGCRLCHTDPAENSVYPRCPSCVCEKWGRDPSACMSETSNA